MAVNNNRNELRAALLEILEVIVVGIMERCYEDESDDENLIQIITSLLSSIGMDTDSSGDVQSPGSEPEETTSIPDDAPIEDATGKDDENEEHFEESIFMHSELPSGDALLSLAESEPAAPIPETTLLGYTVQENEDSKDSSVVQDESIASACSYAQSGGDALCLELGPVDLTPTSEDGPLDDAVIPAKEDVLCADIEQPAKELAVIGELIDKVDPAVELVSLRRKSTWKSVKRVFRVLFCCGCKTV